MSEDTVNNCEVCHKAAQGGEKLQQCARCKNRFYCGKECQGSDWASHKQHCKRQNYVLKVHLYPGEIMDPEVFRTLSCPADATFKDLHEALQIAFGWANTHCYDFKVKDPAEEARVKAIHDSETQMESMMRMIQSMNANGERQGQERYLLRIVEDNAGPRSQADFARGKVDFMHSSARKHPQTPEKKPDKIRLYEVLDKPKYSGKPLEYEYDFGDCWEHQITLVDRKEATDFFMCTDGGGHYVAEDVGNLKGWENLKAAYRGERPNQEQKNKMRWFEKQASNRDAHGLKNGREHTWAKGMINRQLAELAGKTFGFT